MARIQNQIDPSGIDFIFHGATVEGSTLTADPVSGGISATLQHVKCRIAGNPMSITSP
jgi:hypothetical protein